MSVLTSWDTARGKSTVAIVTSILIHHDTGFVMWIKYLVQQYNVFIAPI